MNRLEDIKVGDVLSGTALVGNVRIYRRYQVCRLTKKSYRVVELPTGEPLPMHLLAGLDPAAEELVRQVPSLRYGYIAGTRIVLQKVKETKA